MVEGSTSPNSESWVSGEQRIQKEDFRARSHTVGENVTIFEKQKRQLVGIGYREIETIAASYSV